MRHHLEIGNCFLHSFYQLAVLNLAWGNICAQRQGVEATTVPISQLLGGRTQGPVTDLYDCATALDLLNKVARTYRTVIRMIPADQAFATNDAA